MICSPSCANPTINQRMAVCLYAICISQELYTARLLLRTQRSTVLNVVWFGHAKCSLSRQFEQTVVMFYIHLHSQMCDSTMMLGSHEIPLS